MTTSLLQITTAKLPEKAKGCELCIYIYIIQKKTINKVYIYCCNLLVKRITFGIGYHALSAMYSTVNNFGSLHCVAGGKRSWRKKRKTKIYTAQMKRMFSQEGSINFYIISEWNGKVWKAKMLLNSCITCIQ